MEEESAKSKRKYTVEFGETDQHAKEPLPALTKQSRSVKPREFEIKEVLELHHVDSTPYSTENLLLEEEDSPECEPIMRFPISFSLINLLRKPDIDLENHIFRQDYRGKLKSTMLKYANITFGVQSAVKLPASTSIHHLVLYTHLALAMSFNLENLFSLFNLPAPEPLSKDINCTNIVNIWSMADAIRGGSSSEKPEQEPTKLEVLFMKNGKQHTRPKANKLILNYEYVLYCIEKKGRMDLHFHSYVLCQLPTNQFPLVLSYSKNPKLYMENYSHMLQEIVRTKGAQFSLGEGRTMDEWCEAQLANIVANKLDYLKQIKGPIIDGVRDDRLESLLIGMLGWGGEATQQAVRLLNAYYDETDWQISAPFKPIISFAGKKFHINYLIEHVPNTEQDLVFLVKTWTMNPQTNEEVISFHKPRILRYESQQVSYLWVQLELGRFSKAGYHDWKLVKIHERGITSSVIKILNMEDNKTYLNLPEQYNKIKNARPVQGRVIVHPRNIWDLQLHEVVVDMQGGHDNQGSFAKVLKQLDNYKSMGINCLYLMGVLERDNGPISSNGRVVTYRRPNASPLAVVCRTSINTMLGGEAEFIKLCNYAKQIGMKIVVDCLARVSSSRMHKKYRDLINYGLDENGKKKIIYGTDGRALNYEDTAILNYRRKEAWDLLINQIIELVERFGINGIHLDNGQAWPQIFKLDREELYRLDSDRSRAYTDKQIFEGACVLQDENCGYWGAENRFTLPNPFLVKLCKTLWKRYPDFLIISESWSMGSTEQRAVNIVNSGPIPRMFKLPIGISSIFGQQLHKDGQISKIEPKTVVSLKKWYEETVKTMPKGSIVIQSTTSNSWPYPAFLYKRATWAVVDLFFFLPDLPMTFIGQLEGEAYRTKATMLFSSTVNKDKKILVGSNSESESLALKSIDSKFFGYEQLSDSSSSSFLNSSVKDAHEIVRLQESFVKEVGPQYGYNLKEIFKHYKHRRELRSKYGVLKKGKLLSVEAQHQYGFHTHVIAFVRWTSKELALVAINFNEGPVQMSFNLKSLKYLFPNYENSNIVVEIRNVFEPSADKDNFYVLDEFIRSKIEVQLQGYRSLLWQILIHRNGSKLNQAYECSNRRLAKRINQSPAKWIYSSALTNNLIKLVDSQPNIGTFMNSLLYLFENSININKLELNTIISKTHEFWHNRQKVFKLFGYFKKIVTEYRAVAPEIMLTVLDRLIVENKLGPIAFITPEIGKWSTVGGLGVMVDELSKELAKIGEEVIVVSPYYEYNKKGQTGYLAADGFKYDRNITVWSAGIKYEIGLHTGKLNGVSYLWLHNSDLFSFPYRGEDAVYVTKQLVFFALASLEAFCQTKVFPSTIVTNDWFCGFVSAYVKNGRYPDVFKGTKFMHIVHNLDPLYEGRLYPKYAEGDLNWLIQLPRDWTIDPDSSKTVINPSRCALSTSDNWGTVSHSYKYDLLKESPLSSVLWKYPNPFSFPNGVRRHERTLILQTKTPGNHLQAKKQIQMKYFKCENIENSIPVLSFVGRVTKQKGVHLILEVAERLLYENNFKLHFLIGGPSDPREQYGKFCADRMLYLRGKYPKNVWADPNMFFEDGPLINIGSDFGMMPSLFEPGGIVQHEFFSGATPVISFRTGGLKDTVFEYDYKTEKGNGFNFLNYTPDDFRQCIQRALNCYKNPQHYDKLRENAVQSVIDVEDVAKAWNNEFHRMHDKIFVQWNMVDKEMQSIKSEEIEKVKPDSKMFEKVEGTVWSSQNEIKKTFDNVLLSAQRLEAKKYEFTFHTQRLPRPKQIRIAGDWDNWKNQQHLKYDSFSLLWRITLVLQPGTYLYKFVIEDSEWVCSPNDPIDIDIKGVTNNRVVID